MDDNYQHFSDFLIEKLKSDKQFADAFLRVSLEEYSENLDKKELLLALRHLAEAQGLSRLARQTGLSRNVFYQSLSPHGNPTLDTLLAILKSLKLKIVFKPISG